MIPLRLNLLSPAKRHHLHTMVCFQFIKSILEIILIMACLAGMTVLGAQLILQNYFNDLSNTISFMQSQRLQSNREVRAINQTLSDIDKIQKDYRQVTPSLAKLLPLMPDGIVLSSLAMDMETKQIVFTGTADKRDVLLNFKQSLEANMEIFGIDLPLSQLTIKQNLPFSLIAKLK